MKHYAKSSFSLVLLVSVLGCASPSEIAKRSSENAQAVIDGSATTVCRNGWQFFSTQSNTYAGQSFTLDIDKYGNKIPCHR